MTIAGVAQLTGTKVFRNGPMRRKLHRPQGISMPRCAGFPLRLSRRRALARLGVAIALAGLARVDASRAASPAAAEDAVLARVAAALAAALEEELGRIEAGLRTAAAALPAEWPDGARGEIGALDRLARAAAAAIGVPVLAFDPMLAPLVDTARPPGTPLPASPAADLAAVALATRDLVIAPFGPGLSRIGVALPVSARGEALAVLVAVTEAAMLAAALAPVLQRGGTDAAAQLLGVAAEGGPATELAEIGDAAAQGSAPPQDDDGRGRVTRRLDRARLGIAVSGGVAAVQAEAPLAVAPPSAPPDAPRPTPRTTPGAALLTVVGLGAAGLGALAATALATIGLRRARHGAKRHEAALAAAEQEARHALTELRAIHDTIPTGLALIDAEGRLLSANLHLAGLVGLPLEALPGRPVADVLPPPLAEAIASAQRRVLREGRPVLDLPVIVQAPGALWHERHLLVSCHPVRGPDGRIDAVSTTTQDVTARARAEAGRDLLMQELNHRVKNTLATVQTIAQQTMRQAGDDPVGFQRSFGDRLRALARAHDLLTAHGWGETELGQVLRAALSPWMADRRITTDPGPEVALRPQQAQALVLALHELATNAAKYGALTTEDGRVRVDWSVTDAGEVVLRWVESGGPRVAPPLRRGFGTRLLGQVLRQDLGAGALPDVMFDPRGLRTTVRFRPAGVAPRPPRDARDQAAYVAGWNSASGASSRMASPSATA
jgi:PAS domain S-box-containing protein